MTTFIVNVRPNGETPSISTARIAPRCASCLPATSNIGFANFISMAYASTLRSRSLTHRANTSSLKWRGARAAANNREIILIAENESQETKIARPHERGGYGFDALWNDDFHHSAVVALTGHRAAYYTDYFGSPQ